MKKSQHEQNWTKVNVPVDVGIMDLIDSLSAFPQLQTIESCQGGSDTPAWICFYYGNYWTHPWRDLVDFVLEYLGPAIIREVGDRADIIIRVTESNEIRGELSVKPEAIRQTVKVLRKLVRNLRS